MPFPGIGENAGDIHGGKPVSDRGKAGNRGSPPAVFVILTHEAPGNAFGYGQSTENLPERGKVQI
jgi:hypothetical protein